MKNNTKINFFLVGAARCGTTTLYNYLRKHEAIFLPNVKEPNYFSDVESPKKEDYISPEPGIEYHTKIIKSKEVYNSLYNNAKTKQIKGDTSPSYMWDLNTAQRIYNHNPQAKIIFTLRHPVDRAYSHYIMNYYTGVDTKKSFEEALNSKTNSVWGSCNQYLEMGEYYEQVKAYYKIFPENQIKIIVYEDWTKNIKLEFDSIFNFLQLKSVDYIYKKNVKNNKIKPIKNLRLLNVLRQNNIKGVIKKIVPQERIDQLKSSFFNGSGDIENLDIELRKKLSKNFEKDIKLLCQLTNIEFDKKWH